MTPYRLTRDADAFDPAAGLVRAEHFQMAYVANDFDRACALFKDRLGIREFRFLGGPMAEGGHIDAAFAWVGTLMYEIICASGGGSEIYMDRLPQTDGFAMRHHHLGFLIHDQAQWDGVLASAARGGCAVPYRSSNALVDVCFVDVPELGHYLEYLRPTPIGMDFFENVPRH